MRTMAIEQPRLSAIAPLEEMPVQALWLAGLSLAMLLVPTAISLITAEGDGTAAKQAIMYFSGAILAFLGGLNWGLGIAKGRRRLTRLLTSAVPAILGWLAILQPLPEGLMMLMAAFGMFLFEDVLMITRRRQPRWHARLRLALMVGIESCLAVAYLT